ncbi:hypothetical protein E6R18_08685 [Streptomyces sp. A1277]|nr:hypothetical protein E6R18_08685 [Streptomyces sp. A1277]
MTSPPPASALSSRATPAPPRHRGRRPRSARFQRIMTALDSGSKAALHAYYAARDLLTAG